MKIYHEHQKISGTIQGNIEKNSISQDRMKCNKTEPDNVIEAEENEDMEY